MEIVELGGVLERLAARRPIFHSEADFQHALAWELQLCHPGADIRLEMPIRGLLGRAAVDILAAEGGKRTAIELKYFKERLDLEVNGERFILAPTVARDISRYDVCKDIGRMEHMVGSAQADEGYVVVLSNDPGFWQESMRAASIDHAFKVHEGRTISGPLLWGAGAGAGTMKNREAQIDLSGSYTISWRDFSVLPDANRGKFRALVLHIRSGRPHVPKPRPEETSQDPSLRGVDRPGRGPNGKYEPLRATFSGRAKSEIRMGFDEIEQLVGPLPPSARTYRAWWSGHPGNVWEDYGYRADPTFAKRSVVFRRET